MRLHGQCTVCHKIKQVYMTSSQIAKFTATRVPQGTCSSCQQAQDQPRASTDNQRRK